MRKAIMAWATWAALAAGVVCAGAAALGQYIAPWPSVVLDGAAHLDDEGADVATDAVGRTYNVGWVHLTSANTAYQLTIYHRDGSTNPTTLSRTWAPRNGIHKAHAVAIEQHYDGPVWTYTYIYITGESTGDPLVSGGQDIATLMYVYDVANDQITTPDPVVRLYTNSVLYDGDDVGIDIAFVGDQSSGEVVVTGSSEDNTTGLDSITLGYNIEGQFSSPHHFWTYRYPSSGEDATVCVTSGPTFGGHPTVYVAGYTHSATDDFLLVNLDAYGDFYHKGIVNQTWVYDTGLDERANAVVAGQSANWGGLTSDVYITEWTTKDSLGGGFDLPAPNDNYLTVRFDLGAPNPAWAKIYKGPVNGTEVAYSIAFSPQRTNAPIVASAVFVSGSSVGSGSGLDYQVLRYVPLDGSIPQSWQQTGDGRFDGVLHGADEAYAMGIDHNPGNPYAAGRTRRTNNAVNTFDYGTVRFIRETGVLDPGGTAHSFSPFFFNGTANGNDSVNAISVNWDGTDAQNPLVFVTGYTVDTGAGEDIRTIQYCDDCFYP